MFHVEMRCGMHVVREFNLDERELWIKFLAPLMADRDFTFEGHDFTPRKTRIKIFNGPELRPDQMALGRGWQNVERGGSDVTEAVLARAREAGVPQPAAASPVAVAAPDALRERLIGRLSAGPATLDDITRIAADLMPESSAEERLAASRDVALELLSSGTARLSP